MLSVTTQFNGVSVDCSFDSLLNFLVGFSGSGKTFLFTVLRRYCLLNNIPFSFYDFESANKSLDELERAYVGNGVVLLDNADLYLTPELLGHFKKTADCIVVGIHNVDDYMSEKAKYYKVIYDGFDLGVESTDSVYTP